MKKFSILLTSFVLINLVDAQAIKADDDKWKIGRGRIIKQIFGGNESESNRQQDRGRQQTPPASRNPDPRQQPTPAFRPPQGQTPQQAAQSQSLPQRSSPQPNRYQNPNAIQQTPQRASNNRNFDPRQNQSANNQRLTPAQQEQQRLRWEAEQRAAQQQQGMQQRQGNVFNRNAGSTQTDPRLGGRDANAGSQPNRGRSQAIGQPDYDRNPNQQVSNKKEKRKGPKPVGFGLELKADRNDQIQIHRLDRGGNAEEAGLRRGDQILQIGGVDLMSVEEFEEIAKIMRDGDQIELKVQRSGKTADVMLTFGEPLDIPDDGEIQYPQEGYNYQGNLPTAPGSEYDFVPRQTTNDSRANPAGAPVVDPNAFNRPRPPAERNRPSLHELEIDLDSNFELPPPRQPQRQSSGAKSILESR